MKPDYWQQNAFAILAILLSGNIFAQTWEAVPLVSQSILDNGYTGGEGCQWPQAIEADHTDGSFLLFGTDVGGIYRSIDGGDNWRPCNIGYHPRGNCGFAIDPNNNRRALAVGGNSTENFSHGLYLTTDQGATWKHVLQVGDYRGYRGFKDKVAFVSGSFHADSGLSMVAYWSCPSAGLYRSVDGGSSWTRVNNSYGDCILDINPGNGDVYVANSSGFYKSTDGGVTFEEKFTGEVKDIDVPLSTPNNVFLTTTGRLYKSTDGGETFGQVNVSGYPSSIFSLDVHDRDTMRMVVCNNPGPYNYPIYYSHDGGITWQQSARDNTNAFMPYNGRQQKFAWHPTDPDKLWAFGGDWISSSSDGGKKFEWDANGYTGILVGGIFNFNPFHPDVLYLASQDYNGAFTKDGGRTWKYCNASGLGWGGFTYGAYALDENILVTQVAPGWHEPGILTVSHDGGSSFTKTGLICNGLEVANGDPKDPDVVYFSDHYSRDRAQTWKVMNGCKGVLTINLCGDQEVYGANGKDVVRSDDLGDTWKVVLTLPNNVRDVAIDHLKHRLYIATHGDHLYFYEDGGLTEITVRLPADQYGNVSIRTVAVDPQDPRVVYTAGPKNVYKTDAAVRRSSDSGETWEILIPNSRTTTVVDPPDGANEVFALRVNPATGDLWAAGGCYGVWKLPAQNRYSVTLTAPEDGSKYYAPSEIVISAAVSGNEYPINCVEFFNRETLLGVDIATPYELDWSPVENGDHVIYAMAVDSTGKTALSGSARISVASSMLPEISLTSPGAGQIFKVPAHVEITADASDPDGTIQMVEFFINEEKVAEDATSPYSYTWVDAAAGTYTIRAKATDNTDQIVSTEPITISIRSPLSYFEDFNDGLAQEWTALAGTWQVMDNQYYNSTNLLSENCIYTGNTFALFEYSARLKPVVGNYFGLIFNYSDEDNYYLMEMDASPMNATLIRVMDGTRSTLAESVYSGGGPEVYLAARVVNDGETTSAFINDALLFDSVPMSDFRYGFIGLQTRVNYLWVDDVHVEADSAELHPGAFLAPESLQSVLVFPNPVRVESFVIVLPGKVLPVELAIMDVKGSIIHSSILTEQTTRIPVSILDGEGIYLIRTSSPAVTCYKKLVYMH